MQEQNRECTNCLFYRQHYVKYRTYFMRTTDGHCVHPKRRMRSTPDVCRFWADNAPVAKERRRLICATIEDMQKQLDQIAQLLADE